MKKVGAAVLVSLLTLVAVGCKKKGDFYTDKDVYKQGEVITVTNTTEKPSEHYKWDFGGTEVIAENPIYELPENTPVGTFTISVLPVNSLNTTDNWKRNSKTVTIEEAEEARFVFFLPEPRTGSADEECTITLFTPDGSESETIEVGVTFPNCGSNNALYAATFKDLPSGEHDFQISGTSSSGGYSFPVTLELEDGFDCQIISITDL